MLLLPHPQLNRRFIVTISCTVISLFHEIEGYPVLVKKAGAVLGLPPQPLPNSDASWFKDSAMVSTLVTRSSDDVVHDVVFIPTIVTMGVLVIVCIFCSYRLFISKGSANSRGKSKFLTFYESKQRLFLFKSPGAYSERPGPIFSPQYAVGQVDSSHGSRQPSRGGSVLSASRTIPGSPDTHSVASNMLDRLQRRREEEHRHMQQQDPYEQYVSANQGYPFPQQHYQFSTPHPSVPESVVYRGEGVQSQLPRSPVNDILTGQPAFMSVTPSREQGVQSQLPRSPDIQTGQPPFMSVTPSRDRLWAQQERQSLQQSDTRLGFLRSSAAPTSSTRVSSDVLSYMTPPEARRLLLLPNNSSQPQIQEYPEGGIPLSAHTSSTTQGDNSANSGPANHNNTPPPRVPSSTKSALALTTTNTHVHDVDNQPPGYSTEMMGNNVQGNVLASNTSLREKDTSKS